MSLRAGAGESPRLLRLAQGRALTYSEYGAAEGFPVVALHGTPGSRLKYRMAASDAARLGLRLVSPDRWGYGGSGLHPAPSLAGYAADVAALADGLGLDRFAVAAISGGGPFAAAVAARLGRRVAALALVSPVGPVAAPGAGGDLDAFHRFSFRLLPRTPGALHLVFSALRGALAVSPEAALRLAGARAGRSDRRMFCSPAVRAGLAETFAEGLADGVAGAVLDMRLFSHPWDFDPRAILSPARLWIGSEDRNVPVRSAMRLAAMIPACELTVLDDAGHYWASGHVGEVLEWIAGQVRR